MYPATVFFRLVQPPSSLRASASCTGRIRDEHHFCGIVVRHSYNMSRPLYPSSFSDFLDTGFTIELCQLVVHSSPPYSVFTYSAKDGPKHTAFENSQCLQVLLEHCPRLMPVENYRSYQRLVHGTLGTLSLIHISEPTRLGMI